MASYLQIENISKSYGPKILFQNIGFNINEGDKIALIAPNGTGKTSLMKILAGKDSSDSGGKVIFHKNIRIAFLEQEYKYSPQNNIIEQILLNSHNFIQKLNQEEKYDYELRIKQILTNFNLLDFSKKLGELSGGEIKRVALTEMLASSADFYIMDEPTNHLDIDAIEFLEAYFKRSRSTLFMVTHDRYFLDQVCNTVMEMDHGSIYIYKGDYKNYLQKRQERIENYNAETDKVKNILRRELEWMRSSPCARTGKAKYRKDTFYELKERAEDTRNSVSQIDINSIGNGSRLGNKIINCKKVNFYYDKECYIKDFTYNFQKFEKVGIVGKNGVGKSTFINLLTGNISGGTLTGSIERGESLKIGYYKQGGMQFNEEQTVLETINDTSLLNRFLFPHEMLNTKIVKLSGGEKRRLYLLTILVEQPNLLILDEPTNDLDIVTINILEEYLKDFNGSLIIVSHDRHFLDRLADHLFIFCGDGIIKDFIGDYSEYREYIREYEAEKKVQERSKKVEEKKIIVNKQDNKKKKLSYNKSKELERLDKEIAKLNEDKKELEKILSEGTSNIDKIQEASSKYKEISELLDQKETRWLELSMSV